MTKKTDKHLQQQSKRAAETLLAILTTDTRTEAAKRLGISRDTLYRRIRSYGLYEQLEAIPTEALGVLQQGSIKAAENFVSKVDNRDARVSLEASKEVLDRVGVGKQVQPNTNVQVNVLNSINQDRDKYKL